MNKGDLPVVILGGGGHASVLVDILKSTHAEIKAIVCPEKPKRQALANIMHLSDDESIFDLGNQDVQLVMGLGPQPKSQKRTEIIERFKSRGYGFLTLVSPHSIISPCSELQSGTQVLPGAIINAGSQIEENVVINTGAIIEHDCRIGAGSHVAPGATLCGGVSLGHSVYVGAGAVILPNVRVDDGAVIGAGCLVTSEVAAHQTLYGRPGLLHKEGS